MTVQILTAGFGGQGILFFGKLLAYKALHEGKNVSWLPSYGPEMRGGTASCSVTVSDEMVGSPIIDNPDILVVMNNPSLEKYEKTVKKGGYLFIDSTLVTEKPSRTDINIFCIPATEMASKTGSASLANIVLLGKVLRECTSLDGDGLETAMKDVVSSKHPEMLELNLKAVDAGKNYNR